MPAALGRSRSRKKVMTTQQRLWAEAGDLMTRAEEAMLAKLAGATQRSYMTGWRQWRIFRLPGKKGPFLAGESRREKVDGEDDLMRFVIFMHRFLGEERAPYGRSSSQSAMPTFWQASSTLWKVRPGSGRLWPA